MAVIYDFDAYRIPRLLNAFTRQTGEVVMMIDVYRDRLSQLEDGIWHLQAELRKTVAGLYSSEIRLKQARDAHDMSEQALNSGAIAEMVEAREQLMQRCSRHSPK